MSGTQDVDATIAEMQAELDALRHEVSGWRARFEKGKVRDLNFTLKAGEVLALVGESGSGKTFSALKLAHGLVANAKNNRVCVIDTENHRASHYDTDFDFDVINLGLYLRNDGFFLLDIVVSKVLNTNPKRFKHT